MEINLPLISPLSRKYYLYASETNTRNHYRAIDIRLCLEKVCDEIIIELVLPETKTKWKRLEKKITLHDKINYSKEFMDDEIVNKVLKAKVIGNKGAHQGEEGNYTIEDINNSLDSIKKYSLEIFYSYFVKNGFANYQESSWIPTVFSTLPPIYRVEILKKYYAKDNSVFVIDKLSKAYLKSGMKKEAIKFILECFYKHEINYPQLLALNEEIELLYSSFDKLNIANNLEDAKKNFNALLPAIREEKRDVFICLVSMILNGKNENIIK